MNETVQHASRAIEERFGLRRELYRGIAPSDCKLERSTRFTRRPSGSEEPHTCIRTLASIAFGNIQNNRRSSPTKLRSEITIMTLHDNDKRTKRPHRIERNIEYLKHNGPP